MQRFSWILLVLIFQAQILIAGIEEYFKSALNKSGEHSMDQIDFIYVINLDKRPEKYVRTAMALKPYNIYPYRFSAFNGWEELTPTALNNLGVVYEEGMEGGFLASVYRCVDDELIISHEIMKEVGTAYYCHSLSIGAIGCLMSHLSVLQDAYDSGYKVIWVMEDDVNVVRNPHELSLYIEMLNNLDPEWDILFTDNEIKGAGGVPVPCGMVRPRPLVQVKPLAHYLKRKSANQYLTKIGMRFGAHSMILKRSGIEKILNFIKTYKIYFPYDIEYFLPPGINLYACDQDIVTNIAGGVSDNGMPNYSIRESHDAPNADLIPQYPRTCNYEGVGHFASRGYINCGWLPEFLPYNPVIVEAGAFQGMETCYMATLFPHSKIYAIEPCPISYCILNQKITDNSIQNIKLFNLAFNNYNGYANLFICGGPDGMNPIYEYASSILPLTPEMEMCCKGPKIRVPCRTLDDWCQEQRIDHIDVLKLELEGLELPVLEHSIEVLKNTKIIWAKTIRHPYRISMTNYIDLKAFLESKNFLEVAHTFVPGIQGHALFFSREFFDGYFKKCMGFYLDR